MQPPCSKPSHAAPGAQEVSSARNPGFRATSKRAWLRRPCGRFLQCSRCSTDVLRTCECFVVGVRAPTRTLGECCCVCNSWFCLFRPRSRCPLVQRSNQRMQESEFAKFLEQPSCCDRSPRPHAHHATGLRSLEAEGGLLRQRRRSLTSLTFRQPPRCARTKLSGVLA